MEDSPAEPVDSTAIEAAAELLRGRGERMTGPRRAVLAALAGTHEHLTAENIVAAVARQDPTVHRASVFRTLDRLAQVGVLQRVRVGQGPATYHVADKDLHLHAQCLSCGRVIDLPGDLLDQVRDELAQSLGFEMLATQIALSGRCGDCAAQLR